MTQYIHTTFGSRAVLNDVRNQHLDRPLHLSVQDDDHSRFQLIELTENEQSAFSAPTTYRVLDHFGDNGDIRGWMVFTFITLNDAERDNFIRRYHAFISQNNLHLDGAIASYLLQRTSNDHEIAILSTWNTKEQWQSWHNDAAFPLHDYENPNSAYNLRRVSYSFAAFSKQDI
jgi:heme-degrading monooxygenase HmoA